MLLDDALERIEKAEELSIPFGMLLFLALRFRFFFAETFQFLLGCYRRGGTRGVRGARGFQFLLGCYSIRPGDTSLGSLGFQFLLGCY